MITCTWVPCPTGTTDVTIHTCEERGGELVLAEAIHAVGALVGSTTIDSAFMAYYAQEVGEEVSALFLFLPL